MRQVVMREFFIISAHLEKYGVEENHKRTMQLRRELDVLGVNFVSLRGVWEGVEEISFMLFDVKRENVVELGRVWGQEAVLHRRKDGEGVLIGLSELGEKEGEEIEAELGELVELDRDQLEGEECYSVLPQVNGRDKYFVFRKKK